MTQLTNDALYEQLMELGIMPGDEINLFAGAGTTQAAGVPVKGMLHRIVACSVASASLTMKSVLSNDAPSFVWLINDSPNTVAVFSFPGDHMNGTLNGNQTIATLTAALFMSIPVLVRRKGGASGGGTTDWRAATLA